MQHHSANQLHIERTHAKRALRRLARDRESLRQQIVQRSAAFEALTKLRRLAG